MSNTLQVLLPVITQFMGTLLVIACLNHVSTADSISSSTEHIKNLHYLEKGPQWMLTSCSASRVFTTVFNLETEIPSAMPGQHVHQHSLQYLFYYSLYMIPASFINILPSAIELYLVCNIISSTKLIMHSLLMAGTQNTIHDTNSAINYMSVQLITIDCS